ncbi:hypothetical protein HELRODRAFT_63527 [Helobdella robusta]|uniref:Eukaryotic translation initiation factor 3 subunit A n=1 Tax=Helobdella robusta TaxID=6412 RepID=T1FXH0_HELRO|nr:hypothetical protein HELRODRAFT_63527 [Helobdella robusta]ESO12017.1 hypothetical protein HELRODRAFT_63527 [Helobdella robusta]
MPTYFQRPENALKRANEFIDVGKKQRALDALYDVIKSKKHRTWQKIHEPIMEKYLELCVDLKKSHIAKEGLYQYKNICQQVNTKSLEDIVKRYLLLAEERTENAKNESHQLVVDVDDLDILQTPENVLMSAVSGEDSQDRSDRAILTPWLKFLWESYRQCLDLLRNNSILEKLYQDVAQNAFKFCLKYNRKTEFRKLCENLRTHLGHIHKNQNQQRSINLNNPESQSMHLETRLAQLDSAIQMELWQEAYKAVEDIHSLIIISKKQPKPSLLANYYHKLALVLYKSGNAMFHACTWHKLYHLHREQRKNMTESDLQKLASRVVCATLAIPLPSVRNQSDHIIDVDDNGHEKQKKLSSLLSLNVPPNRNGLIKDLAKYNIISHVYAELGNFYNLMEVDFQPLTLYPQVLSCLNFMSKKEDLCQYVPAIQEVVTIKFINQMSQVYQTVSFSHLFFLMPFGDTFALEKCVVEAAKHLNLQVKINHKDNSVSFGTDYDLSHDDVVEGPHLQSMPSELMRNQLINMAKVLDQTMAVIEPKYVMESRSILRQQIMQAYKQSFKKDHFHMLQRRQIIEDRKEELESLNVQREKEEQEMAEEQRRRQYEAEMARLTREADEREKQRRLDEHRDIQKKFVRERLEQIKSTSLGAKAFADLSEDALANMDMDDILAKQVEQLEKEKKEKDEKLKAQEKKIDYFERAKCLEEIPLLLKKYDEDKVLLKNFWEETEKEKIKEMIKERELALSQRSRLLRIKPDQEEFVARLKSERKNIFKEKLMEFEKHFLEEKKKCLLERKQKRKEERMRLWALEKEEAIQRKKDEELKQRESTTLFHSML